MTVQEFKTKYPHLAHLEGNALWNAMEDAMLRDQTFVERLPGDEEIAETYEIGGYTFNITRGAQRMFDKLMEGRTPVIMPEPQFIMLCLTRKD